LVRRDGRLGVTEYIDCAHHLPGHERCGSLHGHTYQIDVFLEGDHKGGCSSFARAEEDPGGRSLAEYDHKDWNIVHRISAVENICELLSKRLTVAIKFLSMSRVGRAGKWAEI